MAESSLNPQPGQVRVVVITPNQQRFASWMTDVLVYVVVLNLFVEHHRAIAIDSFTISILTAVLLKALLDAILGLEQRVHSYFSVKEGTTWKVLGLVITFSILFLSKFFILEMVDIVFGDLVELGHFLDVVLLIVSMIVARKVVGAAYRRLGVPSASARAELRPPSGG